MSHGHAVSHEHDESHGSLKSYIIGFALSVVLTLLSFGAVMSGQLPRNVALVAIVVLCVAQLLVQLSFFLHLGMSPKQRENMLAFAITLMFLTIIVVGSLWVLHNMNANMMHAMPE